MQPANQSSWFCPQCGHQNQLSFKFCTDCGTGLPLGAPVSEVPSLIQQNKKPLSFGWTMVGWIVIGVTACVLVGVAMIGAAMLESSRSSNTGHEKLAQERTLSETPSSTPYVRPTPLWNDLTIVKSAWQEGGFGTIAIWKVTFKNNSDKPIGNIQYRTTYYSETGAVVDKGGIDSPLDKKVIQKVIPPKSMRTIEVNDGFTNSQAHQANFQLVSCDFVADRR